MNVQNKWTTAMLMPTVSILGAISSASVKMDLWEVTSAVQVQLLFSERSWIAQFFLPS